MIKVRKSEERGHVNHGWLDTYHTFSFGGYRDPAHVHFKTLRVINEDKVAPGKGFGTHPHDNMEIITYVLSGSLEHKDSMGNGEVLSAGELQRMSAGSGITHSEFNASADEEVHLYQIWIMPKEKDIEPSYEQKSFPAAQRTNNLKLVVSPDGEDDAFWINQDAKIYLGTFDDNHSSEFEIAEGRHAWIQVLKGALNVNGIDVEAGDGLSASDESTLHFQSNGECEIMLFDLK